ncbi:chlorophyllide reductase [Devosia sp.]|uniref:chlorophyllide reductase n=1 Tax=Devosia sp. TaxID=1871048 RepID=UPI0032668308
MLIRSVRPMTALLAGFALLAAGPAQAAATTSKGQISVAQVMEMVDLSKTDPMARNAVIAYLAGVGEASGIVFAQGRQRGSTLQCGKTISLSEDTAVSALTAAATERANWTETAATPIIIADMLARGQCK